MDPFKSVSQLRYRKGTIVCMWEIYAIFENLASQQIYAILIYALLSVKYLYTIYNEKYFSERQFSYIVRVITWGHGYASWMRPVAMRKSALQGSGLVRTVGPCAQRRVALMPRAIATARDALSNDRRESAARFERPAKQALALATEPRAKREARSVLCHTCQ